MEHVFFCLDRLGSSGEKATFEGGFLNFLWAKQNLKKKLKFFFEKVEKIGYHSNFNFECNTERGFKESLSIALGF